MEESLNCLRYANRAKNIQNHAVVNVDATSQLVSDLKLKVQRLAEDLIKARTGKIGECSIPMTVIQSLAKGGDVDEGIVGSTFTPGPSVSPSPRAALSDFTSPSKAKRSLFEPSTPAQLEAQKLKAENEAYRVQVEALSNGENTSDALQKAYVVKATEYEGEIARLKKALELADDRQGRTHHIEDGASIDRQQRSESPELSRLKTQMFGSMSQSNSLDAEMEAEERSVKDLSRKYLSRSIDDGDLMEDEEDIGDHDDDGTRRQ